METYSLVCCRCDFGTRFRSGAMISGMGIFLSLSCGFKHKKTEGGARDSQFADTFGIGKEGRMFVLFVTPNSRTHLGVVKGKRCLFLQMFVTPNSPTHLGVVKGKRCLFLQTSKESA